MDIDESIVLVGGGGGVYRVARFLKNVRPNISTVQTVFDHGGHSGELRDERGVLPPGDIRQALLALADDSGEPYLRELLAYRFEVKGNSTLNDATVGNILLTALTEITGSLPQAIEVLSKWYGVKGKVLPVSLDHSEFCAVLNDGTTLVGEDKIDTRSINDNRYIVKVYLEPSAHMYLGAREAIIHADKIVFCPGDLFTSVIPNILVTGFAEALKKSRAKLIAVVNIMTKKAETDGFPASAFARTLLTYMRKSTFDTVICNKEVLSPKLLLKYRKEKASPVVVDEKELRKYTKEVIQEDLVDDVKGIVRHNDRIAHIIASL